MRELWMPNPDYFHSRAEFYRHLALNAEDETRAGDLFEIAALFRSLENHVTQLNHAKQNIAEHKHSLVGPTSRTTHAASNFRPHPVTVVIANFKRWLLLKSAWKAYFPLHDIGSFARRRV